MTDEDSARPKVLRFTATDYAGGNLSRRVEQLRKRDKHVKLDALVAAVRFLRGASSRATFVLPALYLGLGAGALGSAKGKAHSQIVLAAHLKESSLHSIALTCRSIFDDSRSGLSGKTVAALSDEALASVAG